MAEEKKESSGGVGNKEEKVQEKIEDNQNDNNENEITVVIKVDMHCHCQACAKKIAKALKASQGVEDVAVDRKTNMVVVKGKMMPEPMKLCDTIRQRTGRNAHLLSPLPKTPEDQPKDDDNKSKDQHQQQQQQLQQKVDQRPGAVTFVLGVHMHCEACAHLLRKRIGKMKGVESVETDIGKGEVKVKGEIADPEILVEYVHKKTRKHVSLVKNIAQGEEEENHHQDKKEEQDNVDDNTTTTTNIIEQQDYAKMMMLMAEMNRYGHNCYNYNWASARQQHDNNYYNMDHHRLHYDHISYTNNNQFFSDENPNACSLM